MQDRYTALPDRLVVCTVAYVNEAMPREGQLGLRTQLRAVERRALRDGVAIGLLVVESGGRRNGTGIGARLAQVMKAAEAAPEDRVLYVADTVHLGDSNRSTLRAIEDIAAAGFHLRAPCGFISPTGRRATSLRARGGG